MLSSFMFLADSNTQKLVSLVENYNKMLDKFGKENIEQVKNLNNNDDKNKDIFNRVTNTLIDYENNDNKGFIKNITTDIDEIQKALTTIKVRDDNISKLQQQNNNNQNNNNDITINLENNIKKITNIKDQITQITTDTTLKTNIETAFQNNNIKSVIQAQNEVLNEILQSTNVNNEMYKQEKNILLNNEDTDENMFFDEDEIGNEHIESEIGKQNRLVLSKIVLKI